jgi:hypothetical protein
MNYEELKAIRREVLRFDKALQEALEEAMLIEDVVIGGRTYNYGIAGTHLSGAVKRKYIDMKYEINKIIKG